MAVQAFRGTTWAWSKVPSGRGKKALYKSGTRVANTPSTQHPTVLLAALADQECHALGPNSNPRLGFPASKPRGLSHKPSRLGTPEPNIRSPPTTQMKTVPFGAAQNPQTRRSLHASLRPPPKSVAPSDHQPRSRRTASLLSSNQTPRDPTSVPADQTCHCPRPLSLTEGWVFRL